MKIQIKNAIGNTENADSNCQEDAVWHEECFVL